MSGTENPAWHMTHPTGIQSSYQNFLGPMLDAEEKTGIILHIPRFQGL